MHPRSHLIRQQLAIAFEKLDSQYAHIVQGFEHLARRIFGSHVNLGTHRWRGSQRETQNAVAVVILNQRIESRLTRLAAHGKHRKLSGEGDKTFHGKRLLRQSVFRDLHVFRSPQNPLPLPVVTHSSGLEHRRQPHFFHRRIEIISNRDGSKFRSGDSQLHKQFLFTQAILRHLKRARRRKHRNLFRKKMDGIHGYVLELVGNDFKPVSKFLQRSAVRKIAGDARSDPSDWSFRRRIEKTETQPEWVACESQHVPKLSAAEDADAHARFLFFCGPFFWGKPAADGSGLDRTRAVCAPRNLRNASRMCGYLLPRMAAERRAALMAPALPIASVPTGTPP